MELADIIYNIQEARSKHLENQTQKRENRRQGIENSRNRYSLIKDILQDVSNGLSNVKTSKKNKKKFFANILNNNICNSYMYIFV